MLLISWFIKLALFDEMEKMHIKLLVINQLLILNACKWFQNLIESFAFKFFHVISFKYFVHFILENKTIVIFVNFFNVSNDIHEFVFFNNYFYNEFLSDCFQCLKQFLCATKPLTSNYIKIFIVFIFFIIIILL